MAADHSAVVEPAFPGVTGAYTQLSHGGSFVDACVKHVADLGAERVYVVASRSLANQTSHLTDLTAALGDKCAASHIGISSHTPLNELVPIIAEAREKQVDCFISLGGGSVADGIKIVVLALANQVNTLDGVRKLNMLEMQGKGHMPNPTSINTIFVPTTMSGAEFSKFGGATDPDTRRKMLFGHPTLFAKYVVLDPAVSTTTPSSVWLQSGCRAIDHCCEGWYSKNATDQSIEYCREALSLMVPGLLAAKKNPQDMDARASTLRAAAKAMGPNVMGIRMGASHAIGHQLGPLGVGHGHCSCVMLPSVLRFNASATADKQTAIREVLWNDPIVAAAIQEHGQSGKTKDAGDLASDIDAIFRALGMPRSLKEVGVSADCLKDLAASSMNDPAIRGNPVPMNSAEDVMPILQEVAG